MQDFVESVVQPVDHRGEQTTDEIVAIAAQPTSVTPLHQQGTPKEEDPPQGEIIESAARLSIQSGNGEAAWETLIDMIETRHRNDVTDIQENHAFEVAERDKAIECLQAKLKRANRESEKTQMQINEFVQGHAELQAQVDASEETLQKAISASQALQIKYDELKGKYETSPVHDNTPQRPTARSGEPKTSAECSLHEHQRLEQEVNRYRHALTDMSRDFQQARDDNHDCSVEIYHLKRALDHHPEYNIGLQTVVEYKDKMLEESEATATKLALNLDILQKESSRDKDLATGEICRLQALVREKSSIITGLRSSKDEYKLVSENILAMLQQKAYANDIIQAMGSYIQTVTNENQILVAGNDEQDERFYELNGEIKTLQAGLLQVKRLSDEKDDLCKQTERDLCEKENEVRALQLSLEFVEHDLQQSKGEKDRSLAEAENRIRAVTADFKRMVKLTHGDLVLEFFGRKEQEVDELKAQCQRAFDINDELKQNRQELRERDRLQTSLMYYNDAKHHNDKARLRETEKEVKTLREEIKTLQEKIQKLENLEIFSPEYTFRQILADQERLEKARQDLNALERVIPTINLAEVLEDREDLAAAERKIRSLEIIQKQQLANEKAQLEIASKSIRRLKLVGFELLGLLLQKNKGKGRACEGEDDDCKDADETIANCQELLNLIPSCGEEDDEGEEEDEGESKEKGKGKGKEKATEEFDFSGLGIPEEREASEQEDAHASDQSNFSFF